MMEGAVGSANAKSSSAEPRQAMAKVPQRRGCTPGVPMPWAMPKKKTIQCLFETLKPPSSVQQRSSSQIQQSTKNKITNRMVFLII
jgi:hypothetical protein